MNAAHDVVGNVVELFLQHWYRQGDVVIHEHFRQVLEGIVGAGAQQRLIFLAWYCVG